MHELTGSVVAGWVHAGGGSRMGKVRRVAGISGGLPPDGMQEVSGSSPLSSTQVRRRIRTQNRCAFPSERHSEGQDPPEAGRLTSDEAEIVSPPRSTALSQRSRGHQLWRGGFLEDRTRCGLRNPHLVPGAAGGVVVASDQGKPPSASWSCAQVPNVKALARTPDAEKRCPSDQITVSPHCQPGHIPGPGRPGQQPWDCSPCRSQGCHPRLA
jgi:hypothetical protein